MHEGAAIYLAAGLTVVLALVIGSAFLVKAGERWRWSAGAAGLAACLVIADVATRLPGDGVTAGVVLGLVAAAGIAILGRRRVWGGFAAGLPTALITGFILSLPFAANRRFGALGVTVNDDLSFHLPFIDSLARGGDVRGSLQSAYPLGPHSFVAALGEAVGIGTEQAFLGFLLGVGVLVALTALSALDGLPARLQVIGAVAVGTTYLGVAYVVQSSFKETVMALLVLGWGALAREVARDRANWRQAVPAASVLIFGGLLTYSAPAVIWFVAGGLGVLAGVMARERIPPTLRIAGGVAAALAAVGLAVALFELGTGFFREGAGRYALTDSSAFRGPLAGGGNLPGPISFFELFGVWDSPDFRNQPEGDGWRLGVGLAVIATVVGSVRMVIRRDVAVPAMAAACVALYVAVGEVSIAYNAAKAAAIAAPLVMLTAVAGLLPSSRRMPASIALAALSATFLAAAVTSSSLALRSAQVRPDSQSEDVGRLRADVEGKPALYLGRDNYVSWELRRRTAFLGRGARSILFGVRGPPGAAPSYGLDSLSTEELDSVRYVIAPRTLYASLPGPELRLVRTTRWHRLYERVRPATVRSVLLERQEPGAVLDCASPEGRLALERPGRAFVRPAPIVRPADEWLFPGKFRAPAGTDLVLLGNRNRVRQSVDLPPGRWEISLRWVSTVPINVTVDGKLSTLPPYFSDNERFWRVGRVSGGRPIEISVETGGERRLDVPRAASVGGIAAVREDAPGRFVPLKRACGRYVDWIER